MHPKAGKRTFKSRCKYLLKGLIHENQQTMLPEIKENSRKSNPPTMKETPKTKDKKNPTTNENEKNMKKSPQNNDL